MTIARTILRIGVSVFSILLAMLTGAILILLIGKDPILAYGFLFRGAFGSLPSIGETIVKVTPLIFTGEIVLNNSVLKGNRAMLRGGAIWSEQRVTIINTIITNNSAYNETGLTMGGGLYCPLLEVKIINSTISNNHAKK